MLGGNQGHVSKTLASALAIIEKEAGRITALSSTYQTKAWGPIPQGDFLNVAVKLRSSLPPGLLMLKLLQIEKQFGRKRDIKYGPRTLDIDILFYGNRKVHTDLLVLPHPEIQNRRFVLQPCADIIPKMKHPVLKQSITELLQICPDQLSIQKIG